MREQGATRSACRLGYLQNPARLGVRLASTSYVSESFIDDLKRDLLDQIDSCLRESERVRAAVEEQHKQEPFWPERRRVGRAFEDQDENRKR
jgi:hypothetical protein